MGCVAFLSLPGGSEWLCLLMGLAIVVGLIVLLVRVGKKAASSPPPYVPKTCNACGRGNLADARFCAYCGRAIP